VPKCRQRSVTNKCVRLLWVAGVLAAGCSGPPLEAWKVAVRAGEAAREQEAGRRAASAFRSAESLFNRARLEVELQNRQWPFWRDYTLAESLFAAASRRYVESSSQARKSRAAIRAEYGVQARKLQARVRSLTPQIEQSVAQRAVSGGFATAQLHLEAARHLADANRYEEAMAFLARAESTLDDVEHRRAVAEGVNSDQRHVWNRWVQETLANSKSSGERALIVDKAAHRAYLVKAGRLARTFVCEVGYNSGKNKSMAGDGATPEGRYRVTMVRQSGSRYYKALMLNYPNEDDRQRFRRAVASGAISSRARIGSLIEIHGDGGRGSDWTEGCVALTNHDMDELMQSAFVGMQVTIVRRADQWP
jgi:L,D-peptidoglycan transpeptidase YkuD (ErfK/YbiS/YcfS/YnhG family)